MQIKNLYLSLCIITLSLTNSSAMSVPSLTFFPRFLYLTSPHLLVLYVQKLSKINFLIPNHFTCIILTKCFMESLLLPEINIFFLISGSILPFLAFLWHSHYASPLVYKPGWIIESPVEFLKPQLPNSESLRSRPKKIH